MDDNLVVAVKESRLVVSAEAGSKILEKFEKKFSPWRQYAKINFGNKIYLIVVYTFIKIVKKDDEWIFIFYELDNIIDKFFNMQVYIYGKAKLIEKMQQYMRELIKDAEKQ